MCFWLFRQCCIDFLSDKRVMDNAIWVFDSFLWQSRCSDWLHHLDGRFHVWIDTNDHLCNRLHWHGHFHHLSVLEHLELRNWLYYS